MSGRIVPACGAPAPAAAFPPPPKSFVELVRSIAVTCTAGSPGTTGSRRRREEEEEEEEETEKPHSAYQLSIGERARTVVQTCGSGTLCTSSVRHGGVPFGSHVDYVIDEGGRPLFLLANGAAHTLNLKASNRVSLFCQPSDNAGQSGGRTTLVGEISRVSRLDLDDLVDIYVERHPHAQEALTYTDNFHFYRLEVQDVYFVGGYGVAADWVDVSEYSKAEADPIAFEASKLIERLNTSVAEDVRRLCTIFCGVDDDFEVVVVSIDRLGIDVRVTTEVGTNEYRICFREQIGNSFDASSSLVKLLQEAWEREHGYQDEWDTAPPLSVIKYFSRERSREH
mmetsp:Transcript_2661/g.8026  ORF Transcript_2661/g.8026 Transcript_2661/m.8026 type:complete len:339 (+) Transcript_2661:1079-2095(+)